MREMIQKNKAVIRFLAIFLLTYVGLTMLYRWYLASSGSIDGVTHLVSDQVIAVLNATGYVTHFELTETYVSLFVNGANIVGIGEGCNAVSIQILFIAFILAFASHWKKTLLYILFGIIFIHVMNILRIVLYTILVDRYPEYSVFLHDVFFPAVIYGSVFLLWMNWIRLFKKEKKNG